MPKGIPNKQYTAEFKLTTIETMQKEKLLYSETGRKFDVYYKRIMDWGLCSKRIFCGIMEIKR